MSTEQSIEQVIQDKEDIAYRFGRRLAKKHGQEDKGSPKLDKILEMVGLQGADDEIAERIYDRYESGYYDQKFENKYREK